MRRERERERVILRAYLSSAKCEDVFADRKTKRTSLEFRVLHPKKLKKIEKKRGGRGTLYTRLKCRRRLQTRRRRRKPRGYKKHETIVVVVNMLRHLARRTATTIFRGQKNNNRRWRVRFCKVFWRGGGSLDRLEIPFPGKAQVRRRVCATESAFFSLSKSRR